MLLSGQDECESEAAHRFLDDLRVVDPLVAEQQLSPDAGQLGALEAFSGLDRKGLGLLDHPQPLVNRPSRQTVFRLERVEVVLAQS